MLTMLHVWTVIASRYPARAQCAKTHGQLSYRAPYSRYHASPAQSSSACLPTVIYSRCDAVSLSVAAAEAYSYPHYLGLPGIEPEQPKPPARRPRAPLVLSSRPVAAATPLHFRRLRTPTNCNFAKLQALSPPSSPSAPPSPTSSPPAAHQQPPSPRAPLRAFLQALPLHQGE